MSVSSHSGFFSLFQADSHVLPLTGRPEVTERIRFYWWFSPVAYVIRGQSDLSTGLNQRGSDQILHGQTCMTFL